MYQLLAGCFPFLKSTKAPTDTHTSSLRREFVAGTASCIFCRVSQENGFKVVWEDDLFIAFHDHRPAAQYHIQVIPKVHIASVRDLRESDVNLLKTMESIGNKILDDFHVEPSARRMGFHIPPFNSINHLHLHVHALPYKSLLKRIQYPIADGGHSRQKGLSWFVEVSQAIRILESGGQIGVFPC